ncbi:MAG TPA: sulfotransferase family 2 domain-containing protein [Stellaceae bacterium]|nr:sulfotransferase family 2 domain-containing protein [Stellaceae bacterium]
MTNPRLLKYARSSYGNLRSNPQHQFAASHALKAYRSNAIYTFIPKVACSTLRFSLAVSNGCIGGAADFQWIHSNNDAFRASLEDLACARYAFVVLRDPFSRLASCFLDKIVGKNLPAWEFVRAMHLRDQDLDGVTFEAFVEGIRNGPVLNADHHWRPQSDFLVYETYDDYFALERFEDAVPTIEEKTGMTVRDARAQTGHGLGNYQILPADIDFAAVPASEIARLKHNGQCPHPRSLYTERLVELVRARYVGDFRVYAERIGLPVMFPERGSAP